jgi:hypothetical protein
MDWLHAHPLRSFHHLWNGMAEDPPDLNPATLESWGSSAGHAHVCSTGRPFDATARFVAKS